VGLPSGKRPRLWSWEEPKCSERNVLYTVRQRPYVLILFLLWPPCVADADIIFCPVVSSSSSFPRLISAVAGWMSTILAHMVWSEMCCTGLAANTGRKKSLKTPSAHHRTTLSGYIFATKACIDNQEKMVKQQYLLHAFPQYGELRPTSS